MKRGAKNMSAEVAKLTKTSPPMPRPNFRFPRLRKMDPRSAPESLVSTRIGTTIRITSITLPTANPCVVSGVRANFPSAC